MKKLIILLLLVPGVAYAATFDSTTKIMDMWVFTFNVQTSSLSVSTPLNVSVYDCAGVINHRTGVPMMGKPTKCAKTEDEARAVAQKEADQFERDKIKEGTSSTTIEAKRLYYSTKNRLTGN